MAVPQLAEAWNSRAAEQVGLIYAVDGVRQEFAMPGARLEGRRAIGEHAASYIRAVPDCRFDVRSVVESGHIVVVEWTFRGTHTGDLPGLPAQGEEVMVHGVSVCRMDGDLIREERVYWDAASLMAGSGQLGDL